eukprot:SAG31_NODE_315_length_17848_cov_18.145811_4_plen_106_part_00
MRCVLAVLNLVACIDLDRCERRAAEPESTKVEAIESVASTRMLGASAPLQALLLLGFGTGGLASESCALNVFPDISCTQTAFRWTNASDWGECCAACEAVSADAF